MHIFSGNRRRMDAEDVSLDLDHAAQMRELSSRMRQLEILVMVTSSANLQGVNSSEPPPEYVEGEARETAAGV